MKFKILVFILLLRSTEMQAQIGVYFDAIFSWETWRGYGGEVVSSAAHNLDTAFLEPVRTAADGVRLLQNTAAVAFNQPGWVTDYNSQLVRGMIQYVDRAPPGKQNEALGDYLWQVEKNVVKNGLTFGGASMLESGYQFYVTNSVEDMRNFGAATTAATPGLIAVGQLTSNGLSYMRGKPQLTKPGGTYSAEDAELMAKMKERNISAEGLTYEETRPNANTKLLMEGDELPKQGFGATIWTYRRSGGKNQVLVASEMEAPENINWDATIQLRKMGHPTLVLEGEPLGGPVLAAGELVYEPLNLIDTRRYVPNSMKTPPLKIFVTRINQQSGRYMKNNPISEAELAAIARYMRSKGVPVYAPGEALPSYTYPVLPKLSFGGAAFFGINNGINRKCK